MVTATPIKDGATTYSQGCKTDADCTGERKYADGTVLSAAITDATVKAKICCMYYEVVALPTGTAA